ncbi:class I SAM-dependent methyltransferase [Planctomycetes bacterium CA13]
MADAKNPLCQPATQSELSDPMATIDSTGWLGESIVGARVLCLAAGGGRHSALYSAAGADVTVVDLSPAMLELDRQVAAERRFKVRIIETSMEDLSMFRPAEFDIVVQPVSTCYVPDIRVVYEQVARVLRGGGVYTSQHKSPVSLQASLDPAPDNRSPSGVSYGLLHPYYRDSPVPASPSPSTAAGRLRESGAIEFLHRWEQMIGGLCRSGFAIEDLVEPVHAKRDSETGSFAHRAQFIAPYVRIKARRLGDPPSLGENGGSTKTAILMP